MKYAVEMGSGAMIYIPSFMKFGSAIQNLKKRVTQTHRLQGDLISLLFFQNKASISLVAVAQLKGLLAGFPPLDAGSIPDQFLWDLC
jgi:hypothetical protein